MATIEVEVDIDIEDYLNEVSTDGLIYELKNRKDLPKKLTQSNIVDMISDSGSLVKSLTDNLADEMKLEEFLEKFKNIPQAELTTFLNNYK